MRLFAAIPVTGSALEDMSHLLGDLRREPWPVRWVGPDGLHVTLKFFGEVDPRGLTPIEEALRGAVEGVPPMAMTLTELSAFPDQGRPRVIWVGLEGPVGLELLADRVERRCAVLGYPPEGRPFRPHVTLGRVRTGARLRPEVMARLGEIELGGGFVADELVLYESQLGKDGARHLRRGAYELRP